MGFAACLVNLPVKGMSRCFYQGIERVPFFGVVGVCARLCNFRRAGWGKVNMHGAIIDTACAIAAGSRDQTIDMDTIPLGQIIQTARG